MSAFTLLGIIVILVAAFVFLAYRTRYPKKKKKDVSLEYTTALNYLIMGEKKMALEKLRETVRQDTSNINAYLKIGDIFREQGMVDRATKIHRGLLIRRNLTAGQKTEILKSLIQDYQALEKYDRAMQVCEKLLELTDHEVWVQEIMLRLHERSGEWDKAAELLKKILKQRGEKNPRLLALYKVQAGIKLIEEGKERDGRIKFREAIKFDKLCSPAYLYLSDSYIRENRYDDALVELKKFVTLVPQHSYLGFTKIKDILFEAGIFGEVENILQSLLQENPENEWIRFSLVDIYERKGEIDKAIDLCQTELERNPASNQAKRYLAHLMMRIGKRDKALTYALDLVETLMEEHTQQFTCKKCGFISRKPLWHCPECHEWDTFLN